MVASPFGAEPPAAGMPLGPRADEVELEVAVASFLPDGVELAVPEVAVPAVTAAGDQRLDALEHELDEVDAAIGRLDAGTYGLDPVTGARIDDALLAADPTRRTEGGDRSG
jgi:hypothetical protein